MNLTTLPNFNNNCVLNLSLAQNERMIIIKKDGQYNTVYFYTSSSRPPGMSEQIYSQTQ
jgi:hypothetical protein